MNIILNKDENAKTINKCEFFKVIYCIYTHLRCFFTQLMILSLQTRIDFL